MHLISITRHIFSFLIITLLSLNLFAEDKRAVICLYEQELEIIIEHFEEGDMPQVHLGRKDSIPRADRGDGNVNVMEALKGDNGTYLIEGVIRSRKTYFYTLLVDPRPGRISMATTVSEGTNKVTGDYESNITGYPLECSFL